MTTTRTISKTEQREIDAHAKLREEFSAAFAAVETNEDGAQATKLATKRDKIASRMHIAAEKLRTRGYTLTNDDSEPTPPTEEATTTATATPAADKAPDFEWPKDGGRRLVLDYLADAISTERDAPNKGLPFITEGGVLRIRAEHWREWLRVQGITPSKLEAARPIREGLGYSMKPYALPGEGRSHGFYTGPAPEGTEKLPRRILERASSGTSAPRKPRNPLKGLTDDQRLYLGNLLERDTRKLKDEPAAARESLIAALESLRDDAAAEDAAAPQADAAPQEDAPQEDAGKDSAAE